MGYEKYLSAVSFRIIFINLFFFRFLQTPTFKQTIAKRFVNKRVSMPQEKVYLQTDKPYYSAGEAIWFKGYVVNAATNFPNTLSRFIYVELIDKSNTVISRIKIKKDSLGFAGFIDLKPELPSGSYALRAYTFWMQNAGTDFFFKKDIYIGNTIDDFVSSKISYGKTPVTILFSVVTEWLLSL